MIRISAIRLEEDDRLLSGDVEFNGVRKRLYYRSDNAPLVRSPEAFIAASIVAAMMWNEDIHFNPPEPVCYQFLQNIEAVQTLMRVWKHKFKRARIVGAEPAVKPPAAGAGVGVFFSGGVDAGHTLLRHREEIGDLVTIHGLEMSLDRTGWRKASELRVKAAAEALGKPLTQIETNIRQVFDTFDNLRWMLGPILSSTGHSLSGRLRKMYWASSWLMEHCEPWSSHPLLDRHYGSEALRFVHDGADFNRQQKLERVAADPILLQSLRTCWLNDGQDVNCGVCEKCVRTAIGLFIAGKLGQTPNYPDRLDYDRIARMHILNSSVQFFEEFFEPIEKRGLDPALAAAIRQAMRSASPTRRWARAVGKRLGLGAGATRR